MPKQLLFAVATAIASLGVVITAQSPSTKAANDLDAFMKQVLSRRDDNWKKLQQYTLEEDETFQVSALNGRKLFGFRREYSWFPSDEGIFVRSPTSADGVKVSEEDRRKAEANWVKREEQREKGREKREARQSGRDQRDPAAQRNDGAKAQDTAIKVEKKADDVQVSVDGGEPLPGLDDLVKAKGSAEPRFVSSAYFMKFKFDEGSYAFAGREKLLGRDVYKIEYYPHQYFRDPPEKRDARRARQEAAAQDAKAKGKKDHELETDDKIERKMDKVSMITMWIEPMDHQILQYEFSNIDFDFLPGRALVRLDDLRASMRMREAFPGVWLPDTINMGFGMTLALGDVGARYDVKYHDYKLAEVKTRVR